jgi:hypothetical protein
MASNAEGNTNELQNIWTSALSQYQESSGRTLNVEDNQPVSVDEVLSRSGIEIDVLNGLYGENFNIHDVMQPVAGIASAAAATLNESTSTVCPRCSPWCHKT